MPSCQDVSSSLLELELGTLSAAACQALLRHLDQCQDCRNMQSGLEISGELTRRALQRRLEPPARERIWDRIRGTIAGSVPASAGFARSD